VTTARWLYYSLFASSLAHGALAWQLAHAPRRLPPPARRDTFDLRLVSLPPVPQPAPEPPVAAPKPPPPLPAPKPKPRPNPEVPAAPPPAPVVPEPRSAAETFTAPPALIAEGPGPGAAGIVQLDGAAIGALAGGITTAGLPGPPTPPAPRSAPLAKLSDLSRKPRAPSLDAALRENYPAELRRRGTEGQAEVRVVIDPRGRVGEIAVVSETAHGFAEACRRTLLGSRWSEPLDREGQPVSTRLTYRCRFQIER
jgi:periplasmic protein TonB